MRWVSLRVILHGQRPSHNSGWWSMAEVKDLIVGFFELAEMQPTWIRLLMVLVAMATVGFLFGAGMAFIDAVTRRFVGYQTSQAYRRRNQKITEDALRFMDRRDEARQRAEADQRQRLDAIVKGRAS